MSISASLPNKQKGAIMKSKVGLCLGIAALLACVVLVHAAEKDSSNAVTGQLGQPAPPLTGLEWVKGGPVKIEKGSVYVVEFWATWCPPCRASIPHLTELHHEFKDKGVTIVGVSDEAPETVKPFVTEMGEKMDYTVAIDRDGQVSKNYMEAFGVRGIPHAFIVGKDGNIVWHGHPMDKMDEVLTEVVAGQFDAATYAKKKAAQEEEWARLVQLYKDYFDKVTSNPDEAQAIGQKVVAESPDSGMLNSLAWTILTRVPEQQRDLELALKAAAKAVQMTEEKNPSVLDTYALALYEQGKKYVNQAVVMQKKAVELTENAEAKEGLKKALDRYEAAKVE